MKRFIIISTFVAALALTACQEKIDVIAEPVVFTATTESSVTKTALSESGEAYDVVWQNGDQITIVDGEAHAGNYSTTSTTTKADFTFVPESGTEATASPYKAWYPATLYNGGTPALPATQNYVEGNISGAPMYAESGTTMLGFKNLGGIIRLNISTTQLGKKVRRIILSADQGMCGEITNAATLAADAYVASVSGSAGITLDCGENGVAIGSSLTAFHIAIPENSYTNLSITVLTTDNCQQIRSLKSDKSIQISRSQITDVTLSFNNLTPSSLAQHWPFDGNALNAIYGGVDATVYGATLTTDRFGNENSAYYFDGNDKMTAPNAANFGQTSFTANIWVCSNQTSGYGNLMRTDGGYYKGWLLRFNAGKIEIWEGRTSNYVYVSNRSFADGNWHMVTYVRDVENRVGNLYVDGSYIGGYSMTGNINDVTNELRFGTYGDGEYYTGKMDDARLYDKALSQEEISELYDSSAFDLSASETANTYIVSAAGTYKFKATIKGNGGLDPLTGKTATTINPADISGVTVLWEQGQNPGYAIQQTSGSYDMRYSAG